jgi:hypothetical protein
MEVEKKMEMEMEMEMETGQLLDRFASYGQSS